MRKLIYNKLGLFVLLASIGMSCSEEAEKTSVEAAFTPYRLTLTDPVQTLNEATEGVIDVNFTLDATAQLTDIDIELTVSDASTAIEGVDFDLTTHDISIPAFGGQDGYSFGIQVYDDFEIDEAIETVIVTVKTTLPSGLVVEDIEVGRIEACDPDIADMFLGDYMLTSTTGIQGAGVFPDGVVTLSAYSTSYRYFRAVYLGDYGIGNGAQTWYIGLEPCDATGNFMWYEQASNLGCATSIELLRTTVSGTTNTNDDSSFTVTLTEVEELPDGADGGCGSDGSVPVTLTFTKM